MRAVLQKRVTNYVNFRAKIKSLKGEPVFSGIKTLRQIFLSPAEKAKPTDRQKL